MTEPGTTARDTLRGDILASGHDDWVSMAEVRGCISRGRLADSASERQQLMLQTIRSLLQDSLVEVGDIPAPGDPGFLVWPGTLDEVMASLTERIVDRYDDPDSWEYSTWLNLTPKGQGASDDVVRKRSNRRAEGRRTSYRRIEVKRVIHRSTRTVAESEDNVRDSLRDDILASGHDDFVSMADVQACIFDGLLADLSIEQQQMVVDTVRSLLVDGLVEVGVIPSPSSPGFKTWPGTADEVMTRFADRFVGHYDDRHQWAYKIWLNLTDKGQQASADIVRKTTDS